MNGDVPTPQASPQVPRSNGTDDKLSTGEFVALRVEAEKEDKERERSKPASHWDLVKTQIGVFGAAVGLVFSFLTFGDRIVAKAESSTRSAIAEHIAAEKEVHVQMKNDVTEMKLDQKAFRTEYAADQRAMYNVILYRRPDPRFEPDVREPGLAERVSLGAPKTDGGR